ncbi:MAG: hypothetical protein J6Q22_10915 [Prevotella sp.]|nr:hypothetical protein [Prevotella sp.]
MDPNIFKKEDAPSCLDVGKSWDEILNKPDFFEELGIRVVRMADEAEKVGELTRESTLAFVKAAINSVILEPLRDDVNIGQGASSEETEKDESILADAFWDEISNDNKILKRLKSAIEKAYAMKKRIDASIPLSAGASLTDLKDTMNTTVLEPLRGVVEEEVF